MKKEALKMVLMGLLIAIPVFFGCPFYRVFRVPCPGCGLTRAWISFFRGDIVTAFRYHFFFLPAPLFIFLFWLDEKRRSRLAVKIFLCIFALLLFFYNLLRIVGVIPSLAV